MNQPAVLLRGPVAVVHSGFSAGNPVAWKVFPDKLDRRTLAAVQRDRARLSTVSAPILRVDHVECRDGRHALRMELCRESLAARIRRAGPLPVTEVVTLGHAVARALAAAHGAGVLHGAVNPDNVLYRAAGEPVLADFGVALREAFPRDPLHAIDYVAPETLRTGTVTERSDLYGLGAVLHVALTGHSAYPGRLGEQPGERVLRVLNNSVPAINHPGVPAGLTAVITRLLAGDAAGRPADAAWVVTRLADMLPRNPFRETDHLAIAPPIIGRPHRRRLMTGGVLLLVLVTVLFGLGLHAIHAAGYGGREPPASRATLVTSGVELATPQDFGDHVVLTWTSRRTLEFAVVVESDGQPSRYLWVERNHTTTVPVDPARRYCFLVRGTDGNLVYESRPAAIRGAGCHA